MTSKERLAEVYDLLALGLIPGYKPLIAGNHRPRLTGGGLSMARRLQLIPFDVVIPEQERDGRLKEKLLAERDGILGWMIDGCVAWQKMGLLPPRKVRDAVASYFDAEDFVADWIAEAWEVGPNFTTPTADLFASWRRRAECLGINPGNARDLGERLRALGFEPVRTSQTRGWKGICPRPAAVGENSE
jgi:putative DNA primase/helicase